jgi:hypothetical protein
VANPFVQGRLGNEERWMTINTQCAQSGREIRIRFDSELNLLELEPGSDPMVCIPRVDLLKIKEDSIVDIF